MFYREVNTENYKLVFATSKLYYIYDRSRGCFEPIPYDSDSLYDRSAISTLLILANIRIQFSSYLCVHAGIDGTQDSDDKSWHH